MKPLSFHHVCLSVSDAERSVAFYEKLGFARFHYWEDENLSITQLNNGSMMLELMCYREFMPAPESIHATATDLPILGTKHFGLRVASVEAAHRELVAAGVIDKSVVIKQGRTVTGYFFVTDPDGILVEMVQDERANQMGTPRG